MQKPFLEERSFGEKNSVNSYELNNLGVKEAEIQQRPKFWRLGFRFRGEFSVKIARFSVLLILWSNRVKISIEFILP
ncbi:hypothetical protein HZS_4506 [Henneguya salminicola]|nr:hypothetical protein HZS_4506 [Henneguya salminicola]